MSSQLLRTGLTTKLYPGYHVNGPYFFKGNGRWHVSIRKGYEAKVMTLARFLMQEYLGRILGDNEDVDHIDEDKTNDVITNLQVLSKAENQDKTHRIYKPSILVVCNYCGELFEMSDQRQSAWKIKQKAGQDGPFCNKSHAAKFRWQNRR